MRPLALVLSLSLGASLTAADSTVDGAGFIRDWLVLAPFALEEDSGATAIDLSQISKEGDLKPKAGDKQKISEKELTWKEAKAGDYHLDLHAVLGERHEDALAYLVTYVVAEQDMPELTLGIGSNDQARIWLNGKLVYTFSDTRGIDQDSDKVPGVALTKGMNTIVVKVINQKNDWAAALRFLDKDGNPVASLAVKTAP